MYCRNCGKEIHENAAICIHCGVKAGTGNNYCSNCGVETAQLAVVCVKCGCALKNAKNQAEGVNSFGGAIKTCFNKYATFTGRANRCEYWFWTLFTFIVSIPLALIPFLGWILLIALILPSLAVSIRRLHDIGKSGLWYLLFLIPWIGSIILLIMACLPSQEGDNKYGENPN